MAERAPRDAEMTSPSGATHAEEPGSPAQGSRLTVLARDGCHLCDELAQELSRLGIAFDTVDVDQDRDLVRRYGEAVPVVLCGAEELGRAPFTQEMVTSIVSTVRSNEAANRPPES
jgi:glutaredoxin